MDQKDTEEITLYSGAVLKKGDRLKLQGKESSISVVDYLRDRKNSYRFIKIRPSGYSIDIIDAPKLLRGFEEQIDYFENYLGDWVVYTKNLRIFISRALTENEVIILKESSIGDRKLRAFKDAIQGIREIEENFFIGLTTYFEKNNQMLDRYFSLLRELSYKDISIRSQEVKKLNIDKVEEKFSDSWIKVLQSVSHVENQVGFLYEEDDPRISRYNLFASLVRTFVKRGIDKKLRVGQTMSGLMLTKAREFGQIQDCQGHIMISIDQVRAKDDVEMSNVEYAFIISYWKTGKGHKVINSMKPFENEEFMNMVDSLMNQPLC